MDDEYFNDFGFTAVDEQELDAVQSKDLEKQALAGSLSECQDRLDKLYRSFQPLLENLQENPEKDYIWWPNRSEKVQQFAKHIEKIYTGRK
jgi:hypothetical protein